jgi:hypothetical protein
MEFIPGRITFPQLRKADASDTNAGLVTCTGAFTTIIDTPSLTVAVGDVVLVQTRVAMTKGITAGVSEIIVFNAGSAVIAFGVDEGALQELCFSHTASALWPVSLSGLARVTGAGTLVLRTQGRSVGSNSDVAVGGGETYCVVISGS